MVKALKMTNYCWLLLFWTTIIYKGSKAKIGRKKKRKHENKFLFLCDSLNLASLRAHLKANLDPGRAVKNSSARCWRSILNTKENLNIGRKEMKRYSEGSNCIRYLWHTETLMFSIGTPHKSKGLSQPQPYSDDSKWFCWMNWTNNGLEQTGGNCLWEDRLHLILSICL